MNDHTDPPARTEPRNVLDKIKQYGYKAGQLGHRARKAVFGVRPRSPRVIDRWTLPVKLLQRHRILERQRVFRQAGGDHSSMARYALEKARHGKYRP
jgi:hypothetical protein